jgi:predicted transcriptional regulator
MSTPFPPDHRSIDDLLGEALYRYVNGAMRPLWADMPEDRKKVWREKGRAIFDFASAREKIEPRVEEIERSAAERRESIRNGARRAPKAFNIGGDGE